MSNPEKRSSLEKTNMSNLQVPFLNKTLNSLNELQEIHGSVTSIEITKDANIDLLAVSSII